MLFNSCRIHQRAVKRIPMTWQSDFAKKSTAMKRDLLIDVWVKEIKNGRWS
jgi:hypothetical protein